MYYLYRLQDFLTAHTPVQCVCCRRWLWRKDSRIEQATTGQLVRLCAECHEKLYNPFAGLSKN